MAYQTRTSWGLDSRGGEDWRDSAACLPSNDVNPEWFFNEGRGDVSRFNNAAKSVCFSCPVKRKCLDYAMGAGVTDGIFGGLTPEERKALRLARRARQVVGS